MSHIWDEAHRVGRAVVNLRPQVASSRRADRCQNEDSEDCLGCRTHKTTLVLLVRMKFYPRLPEPNK